MKRVINIIVAFGLSLFFTANVSGSTLSKGFNALEIHDYFKAKHLFYKSLKKQPAAAAYGLSIIYSRNNNPFYNLDSALYYAKISTTSFWRNTSEKQKLQYKEYKMDTVAICEQRDLVDEKCFDYAQEINTIESYSHFIKFNDGALQIENAIENRDALAFEQAKQLNTSHAYKMFMESYPMAKEINDAEARYDKQLFKEYTINNTLENNKRFIQEHPTSFYAEKAKENIYELATLNKTVKEYDNFVKMYPNNPSLPKAWRNIYNLSTQVRTPNNIKKFLNEFPDYPFKEELEEDYLLANTNYYQFQKNNKWGFVNEDLVEVIPTIYNWVSDFSEGAAAVMLNDKVGYINKKNIIVIPFDYDEAEAFVNGLAVVGKDEKYGIINRTGETIVSTIYDEIGETDNQYISVELNGKYGFIDRKGNLKVGLEYESVGDFNNGITYVKKNGLYGIIDTNLFYVIKPKYDWIDNLKNEFIRIQENGLYGVINPKGDYTVQPVYSQLTELENGYAMAIKNELYGFVKSNGVTAIEISLPYNEGAINWGQFNEKGFARIMVEGNFGLIDTNGKKFMPALFEDIGEVSSELIAIKRNGKWGFCDYETKLRIPYNFDYASGFVNSYSIVKSNDFYGIINKKGSYTVQPKYELIELVFNKDVIIVKQNGMYGLFNLFEKELIPINYDKIEFKPEGNLILLFKDNGFSYVKFDSLAPND